MRVLVTGAAGFIGSHVVQRCLDEGWTVTGVDDLSNGHAEFLPVNMPLSAEHAAYTSKSVCIQADFSDDSILARIRNQQYDAVVHLAAVPRVSYSVEHPLETNDSNVTKTLKLIQACSLAKIDRFVFASSSSVYGGADQLPTPEHHRKNPKSPYALQKSIIEDYLRVYNELYGLDSACLRFFNVFGPHQLGDSPYATAVSAWLTAIKKGVPMRSDGDGLQSRDMCYVANIADACTKAVKAERKLVASCFNVACGDRTTNKEILEALMKRYPGATYVAAPEREGDVKHTQADILKADAYLGYVPLVRFWKGFDLTCRWYDENWDTIKEMRLRT